MKILIDTCVIIDALQSRVPFAEDAQKLFLAVANMQCEAYITAKASTDIYYLMHRFTHSENNARIVLKKLYTLFHVLDTTSLDCHKALFSETRDFEDAIMMETAVRSGMNCIVTRNLKDYADSSIKVYEPSAFLRILDEENTSIL